MDRIDFLYFSSYLFYLTDFLLLALVYLVLVPFVTDFRAAPVEILEETPDEDVNHFVVLVFL